MSDQNFIVNIKGKQYMTVAGRVKTAHELLKDTLSIKTELVKYGQTGVLFKATVTTPKGEFTGYSMAMLSGSGIEGQSPVEVAETSAVGRALGFAGFGLVEGIASADEVNKAEGSTAVTAYTCEKCGKPISQKIYEYSMKFYDKSLCMDCQKTDETKEQEELKEPVKEEVVDDSELPF